MPFRDQGGILLPPGARAAGGFSVAGGLTVAGGETVAGGLATDTLRVGGIAFAPETFLGANFVYGGGTVPPDGTPILRKRWSAVVTFAAGVATTPWHSSMTSPNALNGVTWVSAFVGDTFDAIVSARSAQTTLAVLSLRATSPTGAAVSANVRLNLEAEYW